MLGKGNKKRKVFVPRNIIEKHLDFLESYSDSEYLFTTESGRLMSQQNLFKFARKVFLDAGVNKKGLHILRHYFASSFIEKNGNISILKALLGHSSVTTTELYANTSERARARAVLDI